MADFASVGELEAFMGTSGLGARGTAMLGYASAQIRLFTGQDIEATTGRQEQYAASNRAIIHLTQSPVTSVSAITLDAVAFVDFTWSRWGAINRTDWLAWDEGPIQITYDSGYAAGSDEMSAVKQITLEVASRALSGTAGSNDTYGPEIAELRGGPVGIFLTETEQHDLERFRRLVAA